MKVTKLHTYGSLLIVGLGLAITQMTPLFKLTAMLPGQ